MKALGGAFVVVAFFYVFYAGVTTLWSYLQVASVVDRAWEDQGRNGAAAVRTAIVKGASEAGVPLEVRFVQVGEDERIMAVAVRWSFPAVSFRGDTFVEIPLSLQRSYEKRP
ncbi:MAG TPA: hypothetical protein VLF19_08080 [Methylomirabilota bacterium]|nr:hypothetical protein [Methylomirabilota bacterium]